MNKKKRDIINDRQYAFFIDDKDIFKRSSESFCANQIDEYLLNKRNIENYFENLTDEQQDVILTLMSRIMEIAYRRGCQQAYTFIKNGRINEVSCEYRYDYDFDISPCLDCHEHGTTAKKRLWIEHGTALNSLGFKRNYNKETNNG